MRWTRFVSVLLVVALFAPATSSAQHYASMPELEELREWVREHHPRIFATDGLNVAIVIVDSNAKYVRSTAFALSAAELSMMQAGIDRIVGMRDDTAWTSSVRACRDESETPGAKRPLCILDDARVRDIDRLHWFASRSVDVLRSETAATRYGAAASNGAVTVTTDTAALSRYARLGVTPENFVSFVTRRTRRGIDGQPLLLTVLMLRASSGSH